MDEHTIDMSKVEYENQQKKVKYNNHKPIYLLLANYAELTRAL
jgi:hypothetical protein